MDNSNIRNFDDIKNFTISLIKNDNGTYTDYFFVPLYDEQICDIESIKDAKLIAIEWCYKFAESLLNTADSIADSMNQ